MFEVSRTESGTPFGNTFFSEIDVDDGAQHEPPPEPAPVPLDVLKVAGKYEIAFDLSQVASDAKQAKGAVRKNEKVKVLGDGDISVKLTISVDKVSGSAEQKIVAAGGSVK